MNDLREDPLTGLRVQLVEHRAGRPNEFRKEVDSAELAGDAPRGDCVFCPGNEPLTPHELQTIVDDRDDWRVRVIPNKYPSAGMGDAAGVHEVIVESRPHFQKTGQLATGELAEVLRVYADRLRAAAADPAIEHRLIFKNVGASAGASLTHLHSQVIAFPEIPPRIMEEHSRLIDHYQAHDRCGWCDRMAEEQAAGERIVAETDQWLAFCPAASRQPYETWILPKEHHPEYESLLGDRVDAGSGEDDAASVWRRLAQLVSPLVQGIEAEIGGFGYNMIVQTGAPVASSPGASPSQAGHWPQAGHWRLEIVPRVASLAGLELATGLYFNVLSPERAALALRERIGAFSLG